MHLHPHASPPPHAQLGCPRPGQRRKGEMLGVGETTRDWWDFYVTLLIQKVKNQQVVCSILYVPQDDPTKLE